MLVSFIWINEWTPAFQVDQYARFDKLRENRMEIITSSITSQSTSKTILNKEISTYLGAHDYLKIMKDHMHIYFL